MEKKEEGFKDQRAIVLPNEIKESLAQDEMTQMLYVTDIGYYPDALFHYRTRNRGARQHILIYCAGGEGWYVLEGQKHKVKKNQFFIISASTPHSYGSSSYDPWSIYWVHFTGSKSILFLPLFNKTITIEDDYTARYEDRIQLFEEIYQNLEMGYSKENLQYTTLCLWHLLGSFRYINQFREINKPKVTDVVQNVIKFMKLNIDKKLSLQEMADSVSYSASHFGTIFLKKTGSSPLEYFNHLKIQKACQLLFFSDLKIKEIADGLGFSDQYYFSKVFTKYMGISPTEYKSKQIG